MDAVERPLQVGNPSAIEIMNRDGPCVIGDKAGNASVKPQFLFAERTQLQHDEIGVFKFIWRSSANVSTRCLQSADADLGMRQRLRNHALPEVSRHEIR